MFKSYKMHRLIPSTPEGIVTTVFMLWISLGMLASCSNNPTQSQTPLLRPIVKCGEHSEREALPVWPRFTANRSGLTDEQYTQALEQQVSEESVWAARVAGITQRNTIKSNATAGCLNKLRAAGTIL